MTTKEERLKNKLEKEKQKQEQRELKEKTKEFTKQYFTYNQKKSKLSVKIKSELAKLGSFKPYYADNEDDRSILLINLWNSNNEEVKNIVIKEAQKYFSIKGDINANALLDNIYQEKLKVKARMLKMKEARKI